MQTEQTTPTEPAIAPPMMTGEPCPVCSTPMLPDTKLEDGDADPAIPVGASIWRCPNTACSVTAVERTDGVDVAAAATDTPDTVAGADVVDEPAEPMPGKSMRCERCTGQVRIEPLPSGHGFKVLAIEHLAPGYDLQATFGISPNGFPICPTDGVALLPVGLTPAGEAFAAVADALDQPHQRRIPGIDPPFDFAEAFASITRKNRELEEARAEYEMRAEKAKNAKKRLDAVAEQLELLISELGRRQKDAEVSARGTLRPGQASPCATERQTGMPCVICTEARKKHAASTEGLDPATIVDPELVSLREHLRKRDVDVDLDELVALAKANDDRLARLMAFAESDASPDVEKQSGALARCHVALEVVDGEQKCERCQMVLVNQHDVDTAGNSRYYAAGTLVGLDCEGGTPAAEPEVEEARTPQRRHASPKDAAVAKSKATRQAREPKPKKTGGKK